MAANANTAGSPSYVANPHLASMDIDRLYHLNLSTDDNLSQFSNVKFVVVGGSPLRMKSYAEYLRDELSSIPGIGVTSGVELKNLTGTTPDRYALYHIGPVLVGSHGIGIPSMLVLMHEVFKLLHHAGAKDAMIFRLGTSGGIGIEPGTLVITSEAVNPEGRPVFEQFICGKKRERKTTLDGKLAKAVIDACKMPTDNFDIVSAKTMCGDDFYEAQGRLDGAVCDYSEQDKMNFLNFLHASGVRNIEMECTGFGALTSAANIPGCIMCVALINRLNGDQVNLELETLKEMEKRPVVVLARYIKKMLKN